MHIVKKCPQDYKGPTLNDLRIGDIFQSKVIWPEKTFMCTWHKKKDRIAFTCLGSTDKNEGECGQMFSVIRTNVEKEPGRYPVEVFRSAAVCLDGEA